MLLLRHQLPYSPASICDQRIETRPSIHTLPVQRIDINDVILAAGICGRQMIEHGIENARTKRIIKIDQELSGRKHKVTGVLAKNFRSNTEPLAIALGSVR